MGPQLTAQNKRKEKARIAARARRSQEASIILEIAHELLITREKLRRIDKATIVKLAIDYIKAYEVLCRSDFDTHQADVKEPNNFAVEEQQQQQQPQPCPEVELPIPKISTGSIFAPKTDDMDSHYLMISECDGKSSFVLKPDDEIHDEDDLTHLAPQAGDMCVQLDVEPLEGIILDSHCRRLCI